MCCHILLKKVAFSNLSSSSASGRSHFSSNVNPFHICKSIIWVCCVNVIQLSEIFSKYVVLYYQLLHVKDFDKISGTKRFRACQLENSLKIGERKNLVLIMMWLFFAKKDYSLQKRLFFAKKRLFFTKKKKIILCKKRLFFAKKKILCKRNRFGSDAPLKMGFDLEFIRFMFFTCLSFVCLSQFTNKHLLFVCISETNATNICLLFLHSPNIRVVSSCPPKTMIGLNKL